MIIIQNIIDNIKKIFELKADKEVAHLLGIENAYLSKMKVRNHIPYKELFLLCEKEKISISFLFYGKEIKAKINYKLKINDIIDNSSDKELEIYYHVLKAEKLKLDKNS